MKVWIGVCGVFALTLACGSSNPSVQDAGLDAHDGSIDAPLVLRTVSGTLNVRHVTTSGEVIVPANLSTATVSALGPPGFTSYPGVTTANGTFSIPGVPVGDIYLKLGTRYIVMSNDSVDLSYDVLGRTGVMGASTATPLTFDVANLATWQATDEIQMTSPGNGTIAFAMQRYATAGSPTVGATSLAGFTSDLSQADYPALINGTLGDVLTLTQLATQTSGTRTFRTVARSFVPTSFSVVNGGSASLTGTFSTVPAGSTLAAVWDRPAFEAELGPHSPRTTANNLSTFAISALPEAATRGFYHFAPDVVVFAPGYTTDSTAVVASWSYGDPYPVAWTRIAWVRYFTYRFVQVGSATPVAVFAQLLAYRDLSTVTAQSPIVPIVGTVISPKINGLDAFGTLPSVGMTPSLSWSAPTLGVASRYYVAVIKVFVQNGATVLQRVATIETAENQVIVPPGILTSGNNYVFEIGARSAANADLSATPNALSLPNALGRVTSSMVTP